MPIFSHALVWAPPRRGPFRTPEWADVMTRPPTDRPPVPTRGQHWGFTDLTVATLGAQPASRVTSGRP